MNKKSTQSFFLLLLFVFALVLTGLFIDRITPDFFVDDVSEKFEILSRIEGEINVLFLGNSRVYRHIQRSLTGAWQRSETRSTHIISAFRDYGETRQSI